METYASKSLETIGWFSEANKHVFPPRCNPLGFTDVDAYCATETAAVCCGLCPNTSVAGLGQFVWACLTYALTAIGWNLAPGAVWGLGIMQILNANAFIGTGALRVFYGAVQGGMTRFHTKFLFSQALGCIAIMGSSTFAPQWVRLGRSEVSIEEEVRAEKGLDATRADVRAKEKTILRASVRRWSHAVLAFWFINLSFWTALYAWLSYGEIEYSQANCESVFQPRVTPDVATLILGIVAWLLLFADFFVVWKETGLSDWLIDTFIGHKGMLASDHRKMERKITQSVTAFLYALWFAVNFTVYYEGLNSFLLTGADFWTFGQVEQMTALFPDLLGLAVAWMSYLQSRDQLEQVRDKYRKVRKDVKADFSVDSETSPTLDDVSIPRGSFDIPPLAQPDRISSSRSSQGTKRVGTLGVLARNVPTQTRLVVRATRDFHRNETTAVVRDRSRAAE